MPFTPSLLRSTTFKYYKKSPRRLSGQPGNLGKRKISQKKRGNVKKIRTKKNQGYLRRCSCRFLVWRLAQVEKCHYCLKNEEWESSLNPNKNYQRNFNSYWFEETCASSHFHQRRATGLNATNSV